MITNSEITRRAASSMQGRWGYFMLMTFAVYLFTALLQAPGTIVDGIDLIKSGGHHVANSAFTFGNSWNMVVTVVLLPLTWGYAILLLRNLRGEQYEAMNVLDGFRRTNQVMGTMLLVTFRIALCLVPLGIVVACAKDPLPSYFHFLVLAVVFAMGVVAMVLSIKYSMVPYILHDTPLAYNAAIRESSRMIEGFKMQYFMLLLRMLPWVLLGVLTLGIGLLAAYPYVMACQASFYEALREHYSAPEAAAEPIEPAE